MLIEVSLVVEKNVLESNAVMNSTPLSQLNRFFQSAGPVGGLITGWTGDPLYYIRLDKIV